MSEVEVWTFHDTVEHLLDLYDLPYEGRNLRQAVRAVLKAYRDLPQAHRWSYFYRSQPLRTEASQDTGSVVYDHTGGTFERQLTLSGATWPTTAAYGRVTFADTVYDVSTRESDTIVTLTEEGNPGADVASTDYTWFRSTYPLPVGLRRASPVVEGGTTTYLEYVTPAESLARFVGESSPGSPHSYTFRNDGKFPGRLCIDFVPPPSSSVIYDFMAEVSPRSLAIELEDTGSVSVSAGSTTVTGSSTLFSSKHAGCVIRFSDANSLPTSVVGSGLGNTNPYYAQRFIRAVASATSLTIDSVLPGAVTGVKFSISDPIDIDAGAMYSCFLRMCEAEFARLIRSKDAADLEASLPLQMRLAASADSRDRDFSQVTDYRAYQSLGDWAIIDYES